MWCEIAGQRRYLDPDVFSVGPNIAEQKKGSRCKS